MTKKAGPFREAPGAVQESNNQMGGRSGSATPTRRRKINANGTSGGGINRSTRGK